MPKKTMKQGNDVTAQSISLTRTAVKIRVGRVHLYLNRKGGELIFKHVPPNTAASNQQVKIIC